MFNPLCRFSPPFSQNNRDNNYLNLSYEYKGKMDESSSEMTQRFLINDDSSVKTGGIASYFRTIDHFSPN